MGSLGGAAGGAMIGAAASDSPYAIAAGAIMGFLVGGAVGSELDRRDQQALGQATYQALEYAPVGQRVPWQSPQSPTRRYGYVQPGRAVQTAQGPCRDVTQVIFIDGRQETAWSRACREADGTWTMQ